MYLSQRLGHILLVMSKLRRYVINITINTKYYDYNYFEFGFQGE